MAEMTNLNKIPKDKFNFVNKSDISHDKKPETKPVSAFRDAFNRFCKNKSSIVAAIIIAILVLFAIIAPFCTPYKVSYTDDNFQKTLPKSSAFKNTNFWDGCRNENINRADAIYFLAIGKDTGHNVIKNGKYSESKSHAGLYSARIDYYQKTGCIYKQISGSEYEKIQKYQDEKGIQVIFPYVLPENRPQNTTDERNANYYFLTEQIGGKTTAVLSDANDLTSVIPVYQTTTDKNYREYISKMRVEGENGMTDNDGTTYYYAYAAWVGSDDYHVRLNYYEYYKFYHSYLLKDGITEPIFLFGTTSTGQDILTCLASGARFSFMFAIAVALVNMIAGAIYGAIEGYYGGKIDLVMERVSDILSAVPFMIVITLLKLHMGGASQVIVLFISFILTGWIGMAGTTRMQFYRYKNQEYVLAARTLGARDRRLMWKHIFPNAIGTLITSCSLAIPSMIYSEVNLSYLGIINLSSGNLTSVGTLLANGQACMTTFPHVVAFPAVFLVLLMLSFNLLGNGLRDAFNPSLRGTEG